MAILSFSPSLSGRRNSLLFALVAFFIICTLWFSQNTKATSTFRPFYPSEQTQEPTEQASDSLPPSTATRPTQGDSPDPSPCDNAPGANDIYIALKTGVNEIYQKLPQHILTLFQCIPDYGVFSDVEQNVGGQYVYDALHDLNDTIKTTQKEFTHYRDLNSLYADGQDVSLAKKPDAKGNERKGWILDKWKFLQSYRKAYLMYPDKKWYLFIEADTAILLNNLILWINGLDHEREIYSGSQNSWGGVTFAHGGSGVLVSRAAMRRLMGDYDTMLEEWQMNTADSCCGDVEIARSFKDVGVDMTPSFPILQGETPMTIDWSERHMCAPSVSWHHVSPMEIQTLWELQTNWTRSNGANKPYLFRDLFADYVTRHVRERREEWDNISVDWKYVQPVDDTNEEWTQLEEIQRQSIESFDNCRAACYANDKCRQYKFQPGECALGEIIRIGKVKKGSNLASGWILERVEAYRQQFKDCETNWAFDQ